MKTTVELDDELLKAAKKLAIDEHTTLRALIEGALRTRVGTAATSVASETPAQQAAELRRIFAEIKARNAPDAERLSKVKLPITREEIYDGVDEEWLAELRAERQAAERRIGAPS